MRTLKITRQLVYYDVPQIFIAEDAVGIRYLCLYYDIADDGDLKYISVQVSRNKLNDFIKGHIDLLSMITNTEQSDSTYVVTISGDTITAEIYNETLLPEMLPEEGYYYDDSAEDDKEMVERAVAKNKPIIRLAFDTPENHHDIDSRCLSAALVSFQSLVDSSYKKLYKNEDPKDSMLRVSSFSAASFDVELYANEGLDMFGQSKLSVTMDEINKLFSDSDSEVIETLRALKGFAANNFRRFLDVLLAYGVSINYKWIFSTSTAEVHRRKVSTPRLKNLQNIINSNSDLGTEEQTYEGFFKAASVDNGKWTFVPNTGKELKGDCIDNNILKGITLTDVHYKITCQASQVINETTLKEKTKYTLICNEKIES